MPDRQAGLAPVDVRQTPAPRWVIDIQQELERAHRRLPDREAQRQLRERLRYKHIGTLSTHLQDVGDAVRSKRGVWYLIFVGGALLAYVSRFGF